MESQRSNVKKDKLIEEGKKIGTNEIIRENNGKAQYNFF